MHGVYATGWIKRGPVGLIGNTKSDAMETVKHVINDQADWWHPEHPQPRGHPRAAGIPRRALHDPRRLAPLDEHEIALGAAQGRARIKVVPRDEMVRVSRDAQPGTGQPLP